MSFVKQSHCKGKSHLAQSVLRGHHFVLINNECKSWHQH